MNDLVYVNIDQGIYKVKNVQLHEMKKGKTNNNNDSKV